MLGWLKTFIDPNAGARGSGHVAVDDRVLAAAALMVEMAARDGSFDEGERMLIERLLCRRFGLSEEAARALIEDVVALQENASDIYRFTSVLNKRFTPEERLGIVEMLWEVVYADGEAHHYETNLMRRLAGLLYLEDADVGAARRRVRERLPKGVPQSA